MNALLSNSPRQLAQLASRGRFALVALATLLHALLLTAQVRANDPPATEIVLPKGATEHLLIVDLVSAAGDVVGHTLAAVVDDRIAVTSLTPLRRAERLLGTRISGTSLLIDGVVLFDRDLDLVLLQLAKTEGEAVAPFPLTQSPDPGEKFHLAALDGGRDLDSQTTVVIEQPADPVPADQLLCDATPELAWRGAAWITEKGHLAGFGSAAPFVRSGQSAAVPGRVLKNLLRRNRERLPLSLAELRDRLSNLTPNITQLFPSRKFAPAKTERGQQLEPLRTDLRFTGPEPAHPFLLGEFRTESGWQLGDKQLIAPAGKAASLLIATGDELGIEFELDASGKGGWFLTLGFSGGSGHILSNVATRKSGSPWLLCELSDGKAVPNTLRELTRHTWTGSQKLALTIKRNSRNEYHLDAQLANRSFLEGILLQNYQPGDIYLATYNTQYGPMPLRVSSIRAKSLSVKPKPAAPGTDPSKPDAASEKTPEKTSDSPPEPAKPKSKP